MYTTDIINDIKQKRIDQKVFYEIMTC